MKEPTSQAELALRDAAREYHRGPTRGKISITPTKPLSNQRDLSLAYSPGVAYPCLDIQADPALAFEYTSKANLVGVITNGTAVLGLGDIARSRASRDGRQGLPVQEVRRHRRVRHRAGRARPGQVVDIVAALEPTLGGVNLEDIKAGVLLHRAQAARAHAHPVFHDDQHGTAIITGAALLNALELVGKKIQEVKLVSSGAGAAAIACLDLMVAVGLNPKNVFLVDSKGVVYPGRPGGFDESKAKYAQDTSRRTLAEVVKDADVFLGCSTGGVLTPAMVQTMAPRPVILALANPEPEIRPELARQARPDCIIATGRSDYPNQVNNVLCFPYIFRGALDCGATRITEAMKLAAMREIAQLAKADISEEVASAYAGTELKFGPDYIIPTPFDSRLILRIAPAVARAAAESGAATRPIADFDAYTQSLTRFVYQTGMIMRPVFVAAKQSTARRVAYAEGEDERVLRAAQMAIDDGLAQPILIGRPAVIEMRIAKAGLRLKLGDQVECINPESDARFRQYWETYHRMMGRDGVTPEAAKAAVRRSNTLIGALAVHLGDADAMLCGMVGRFEHHLEHVRHVIGCHEGEGLATLNALMLQNRTLFIADTYVNEDPDAQLLARIALMSAVEVKRFGLPPKVAFLSHGNYGSSTRASAWKMRQARDLFRQLAPEIECDGELQGDAALSEQVRRASLMESTLEGEANLLICPNLDAANILFNVLKMTGGHGVTVGPMLLGARAPVHVLTPSATVRRIVNMTALVSATAVRA